MDDGGIGAAARDERHRQLGIDCVASVTWKQWEVGVEATRKLRIQNVDSIPLVVEYSLPTRKTTFEVPFPEPQTLGSGMAFDLAIRFCPTSFVEYNDSITITVRGRGSFSVQLTSLLPFARLGAPDKIDFNYIAVSGVAKLPFRFTNEGTVPLQYRWEIPEPFFMTHREGELSVGETITATITFAPTQACVALAQAVCYSLDCDDEILGFTRVSGIGKYPYVCLANGSNTVDFGDVTAGASLAREVSIQNKSAVPAVVAIRRVEVTGRDNGTSGGGAVSLSPTRFLLESGETFPVSVTYSPSIAETPCAVDYVLEVAGGNSVQLAVRGNCTAPVVSLSAQSLNYGDVNMDLLKSAPKESSQRKQAANSKNSGGEQKQASTSDLSKLIVLKSHADVAVNFQFAGISPGAAFVLEPSNGKLAAGGSQKIRVTFRPTHPMNYLRRFFLLIAGSVTTLTLDVYGSAYDNITRPLPFGPREVDAFFTRNKLGLSRATPEQLADAATFPHADYLRTIRAAHENTISAETEKQVSASPQLHSLLAAAHTEATRTTDERKRGKATDLSYVFAGHTNADAVDTGLLASVLPFSLDKASLTFSGSADSREMPTISTKQANAAARNGQSYGSNARATRMSHGESDRFEGSVCQILTVYNHTGSDGFVWWCSPAGAPWRVSPSTAEVPANGSTSFRVFLDWGLCESERGSILAARTGAISPADTVGARELEDAVGKGGARNRAGERKPTSSQHVDDGKKNLRGGRNGKKSDRATNGSSGFFAASAAAASPDVSASAQQPVACLLECYANFKEMRSFRTVPDNGFTPPHCLLVQCQYDPSGVDGVRPGSTPSVKCTNRVVMPPCLVGRSAYAVVPVTNERDVPTLFSLAMTSFVAASDTAAGGEHHALSGGGNSGVAENRLIPTSSDANAAPGGTYSVNDTKVLTAIAAWDRLTKGHHHHHPGGVPYDEDSAGYEQSQGNASEEKYVSVAGVFDYYPRGGIIGPRQTQFVLIKFTPPDESGFLGVLRVMLGGCGTDGEQGAVEGGGTDVSANGTGSTGVRGLLADADQNGSVSPVLIRGYGSVPRISVNVGPKLYFRPTCVHGRTERKIVVRNEVGVPTQCSLGSLSAALSGVIHVDPPTATVLAGYQEGVWTVSFTPDSVGEFRGQLTLRGEQVPAKVAEGTGEFETVVNQQHHSEHAGVCDEVALQVLGEAVCGEVDVEPAELTFGAVVEGRHVTRTFGLFNSGVCDLYYEVRWRALARKRVELDSRNYSEDDADEEGYVFASPPPSCPPSLIHCTGKLNARTETTVQVTLVAQEGIESYILYAVVGGTPESLCVKEPPTLRELRRHPHCIATFTSQQPAVTVVDVRSAQVRRSVLWEQFSVNAINTVLSARGAADVLATVDSMAASVIECEIGSGGTLGADPVCVRVCLRNTGSTNAIIAIRLPTDHGVPKETWFDVDRSLETVQHIVDQRIITVSPLSGVISPGGTLNVDVSYVFKEPGVHRLPVVLQLENGPQTTLVLTGSTTPPSVGVLAVHPSHVLSMIPVPIGDLEPPMQYTQLENPTADPVEYAVDEDGLARIAQKNYNFPVFHCVNPVGVVPPFSHVQLAWYFRPLEAKAYTANITIRVKEGEDIFYSLSGEGYHPSNTSRARRQEICQSAFTPITKEPFLPNPGTPLSLSYDVLSFGTLPFFCFRRSTCTLINTDPRDTFEFAWDSRLTAFGDCVVDVAPQTGSIGPGERVEFRVCMYAGCGSHRIESSVMCNTRRCNDSDDDDNRAETTGTACAVPIELFVQALVMPTEQYTAIYGEESAKSFAFPTLHSFASPHVDPMQCVTRTERSLLRNVLDEAVKGALTSHSVQSALSDPADDDVPFYVPRARNAAQQHPLLNSTSSKAANTAPRSQPTLSLLYDVVEGIIESVVHDTVRPSLRAE